jgi:hypothetical protein
MSDSKNLVAWKKLFDSLNIIETIHKNGLYEITATTINSEREARLMTKFDNYNQLPEIFSDNKLGILPTSRGSYIIGQFDMFHKFETDPVPTEHLHFHNTFETLNFDSITSEPMALSCAFNSKILDDFFEDNVSPTVSGRMGTDEFDFSINGFGHNIQVDRAQIEIDGGYEGEAFNIVEAKNFLSDDFVIRQLYYPFRKWEGLINKKIRTHYLTYSNGIFELREYQFTNREIYNSLSLVKAKRYAIYSITFNLEVLQKLLDTTSITNEPTDAPFPQADSVSKIFNLLELLNGANDNELSKEDITLNFGFDGRQTDYYLNACKYLGLAKTITKNGKSFGTLTEDGLKLFSKNIDGRRTEFIQKIISKSVFNKTLKASLSKADIPSKDEIVEIMKQSNLNNVTAETTFYRRASTIAHWVGWIIDQASEGEALNES